MGGIPQFSRSSLVLVNLHFCFFLDAHYLPSANTSPLSFDRRSVEHGCGALTFARRLVVHCPLARHVRFTSCKQLAQPLGDANMSARAPRFGLPLVQDLAIKPMRQHKERRSAPVGQFILPGTQNKM